MLFFLLFEWRFYWIIFYPTHLLSLFGLLLILKYFLKHFISQGGLNLFFKLKFCSKAKDFIRKFILYIRYTWWWKRNKKCIFINPYLFIFFRLFHGSQLNRPDLKSWNHSFHRSGKIKSLVVYMSTKCFASLVWFCLYCKVWFPVLGQY